MYNSTETYDSPFGPGWSHSFDWRLHQARQITAQIVPPVTNQNFKIRLWEGTRLWCDGHRIENVPTAETNGLGQGWSEVHQTNLVTLVFEFLYGSPVKNPVEAYVVQPGNNYSIHLDQPYMAGAIGDPCPMPVAGVEDLSAQALPLNETQQTRQWLEVYRGDGNVTRFLDTQTNGVYWATDRNWSLTETNGLWTLHLPGGQERIFNAAGRMIRDQDGWGKGIRLIYNADGELTTAEHDNGLALQFTYTNGHVASVFAGAEASLTYSYTSNGLLDTVIQQYGAQQRTRRFEYTDGVMTRRINPEGHEYNYGYELDAAGHRTVKANSGSVNPGNWMTQALIYRSATLTDFIAYTRGMEQWSRYAYSSKNNLLTEWFGPGTNAVDAETRGVRYRYNAVLDETKRTDFDDHTGRFFLRFQHV